MSLKYLIDKLLLLIIIYMFRPSRQIPIMDQNPRVFHQKNSTIMIFIYEIQGENIIILNKKK